MPIVFVFALAGSLAIHAAALFGTDVALFGGGPQEPIVLRAEIQPPPPVPQVAAEVPPPVKQQQKQRPAKSVVSTKAVMPVTPAPVEASPEKIEPTTSSTAPDSKSPGGITNAIAEPAKPILAAKGTIRFAIFKESIGLQVGRAEHSWEFSEDGRYRLTGITETSGLAALLKPVRIEVESRGSMVAGGLQPETYRSLKNGQDSKENADFEWSTATVALARDGSVRDIAAGTQDILSLNYQLAYLGKLAEGSTIGVVTGKKYERYSLDSLGEEEIEVPAGRFRTLHLRAMTDNTTEIWIALDRQRLPVKIRFTDKKGESFEQVATELGSP
jgi:hypothetical protein